MDFGWVFFLSSLLNYLLAVIILTAEPGTVAFNEQLGKMTALSFPVIALPATAVLMGNLFLSISRYLKINRHEARRNC